MKEEEAKTKQCPIINGQRPSETKCIASECMMWVQTDNEGYPSNAKNNDPDNAVYFPAGHCGLARKI